MLTFFRRIRKGLLDIGAAKKYLFYALGEIALVVIGILIALQVNNWNETRISTLSLRTLLHKLASDLDYDISHFNEIDSIYQTDLKEIDFVFEEALSQKNSILINTNQMIVGRGSVLYLKVTKSTYGEMMNTGFFYQLSNDDLKTKINAYYEMADFVLGKENKDNQNLNNWILGIKNNDTKNIIMRLREHRNLDYIDWTWLQNPNSAIYKEIETTTMWTKAAIESNLGVMERLRIESRFLINEILTYLRE